MDNTTLIRTFINDVTIQNAILNNPKPKQVLGLFIIEIFKKVDIIIQKIKKNINENVKEDIDYINKITLNNDRIKYACEQYKKNNDSNIYIRNINEIIQICLDLYSDFV